VKLLLEVFSHNLSLELNSSKDDSRASQSLQFFWLHMTTTPASWPSNDV